MPRRTLNIEIDGEWEMKKEVSYTSHLQLRMRIREIGDNLPRKIYEKSKEIYFDFHTEYYVAVSEAYYKGKTREMAVTYEETADEVKIITIHPLKLYEKLSKIRRGRWQKSERETNR